MAKRITTKRTARTTATNETARKLVLASLGAVSLAQKQGEKIFETLVDEGTQFQARANKFANTLIKDARKAANDVQKQVKGAVKGAVNPYKHRASSAVREVEDNVSERIGSLLGRFGVPSKNDIEELLGRVSELNRQVKSSTRSRAA